MKVKIGDRVYDANEEPIMVILTEQDKVNILNMIPEATKYCVFPDTVDTELIKEFMKTDD